MFASRTWIAAAGLALAGMLAPVRPAAADPGPGRVALLGQEAARFMGAAADSGTSLTAGWIAAAFCIGLMAAFLGTYFGMRLFAFGRCVERGGWREVTYRFRSTPVAIRGDMIPRMTGLLEELERLGAGRRPETPMATVHAAEATDEAPVAPVKFARRAAATPAAPAPAAHEHAPVHAFVDRDESTPTAAPPAVPAPAPVVAPAAPVSRYRRARALLQEGHDLVTIQAMTGLKRAEIDLVRCVPSLGVAP